MPRSSYPSVSDLLEYLGNPTLPDVIADGLQSALDSAVEDFEKYTNISPFLVESEKSETVFSSTATSGTAVYLPTTYLDLESLYENVSSGFGGTLLVKNQDYEVLPSSGPAELIRFSVVRNFGIQDLKAVGYRGYASEIPEDVYMAIINKAAIHVYNYQAQTAGGYFEKVKQGPVELTFGSSNTEQIGGLAGRAKAANDYFNQIVAKYKRVKLI